MIQATAGDTFDAILEGAPSGLEGTIGVRIVDPTTETTVVARATAGINEYPAGSGVYGVTLTAPDIDDNPSPWNISVLWDTVSGGTPLTPSSVFTEELVVYAGPIPTSPLPEGSPYFTVAEFRARYPDVTEAAYSDDTVNSYREAAEAAIEHECGVAFVPREETLTLSGDGGPTLPVGVSRLRDVTAATLDGDTVDLTGVKVTPGGAYLAGGWTYGISNYTVTIEHGYDAPPARIKLAAMALTRAWMLPGPADPRRTQLPVEGGGVINLATPGMFGATFGVPEVDAAIRSHRVFHIA